MIIFPAIDIKGGKCVRLYMGDFSTAHEVANDPVSTALEFAKCGSEWLHMVDLDGSLQGKRINEEIFIKTAKQSGLKTQVGGGVRNMETIDFYINNGISRVILGTAAINNPAFVEEAVKKYGEKIAVGIDAKDEMAAGGAWTDVSEINYIELAKKMEQIGVSTIIYTDISKDGTLKGPNTGHYSKLLKAVSCNIIASGGIRDINDIKSLDNMGLHGAICGKSLYSKTLNLAEAINFCRDL